MEFHNPGNYLKIEHIWAFISVDEKGNEGIVAVGGKDGVIMPLVAADEARLDSLRQTAKMIKSQNLLKSTKIKLIRFSVREDLEEI